MHLIFTTILGWFSSLAGRFLSDTALKFIAYKALLVTLLTVTLPVIAKNLMTWLFQELVNARTALPFSVATDTLTKKPRSVYFLMGLLG